jgi:hypothetical protein
MRCPSSECSRFAWVVRFPGNSLQVVSWFGRAVEMAVPWDSRVVSVIARRIGGTLMAAFANSSQNWFVAIPGDS